MSIWADIRKRGLGIEKKSEDSHQDYPDISNYIGKNYATGYSSYAEGRGTYIILTEHIKKIT